MSLKESERDAKKQELKNLSIELLQNQEQIKALQGRNRAIKATLDGYMSDHNVKKFERVGGTQANIVRSVKKHKPTVNKEFIEECLDKYKRKIDKIDRAEYDNKPLTWDDVLKILRNFFDTNTLADFVYRCRDDQATTDGFTLTVRNGKPKKNDNEVKLDDALVRHADVLQTKKRKSHHSTLATF